MDAWVTSAFLLPTALFCFVLAVVLVLHNHRKSTHWAFALLAVSFGLWTLSVVGVIHAKTAESAKWHIQLSLAAAAFFPATFYQFIAVFPRGRFDALRWLQVLFWIAAPLFCIGAFSPWYIAGVTVFPDRPPEATYGPVFVIHGITCVTAMAAMLVNLIRKVRAATGVERRQLQHILLGIFSTTILATATNILGPLVTTTNLQPYGPVFGLFMMGMFAYSMVRYNLLDLWELYSRTTLYAVMTAFVIAIFLGTVSLIQFIFSSGGRNINTVSIVLAAIVIATVLEPLKERMELLLDRFVLQRRYDIQKLFSRVSANAARIVRLNQLVETVVKDISMTVGVDDVRVLLVDTENQAQLVTEYASTAVEACSAAECAALLRYLRANPTPIVLEYLVRSSPGPEGSEIGRILAEWGIFLCIPLVTTSGLVGMVALGEKASRDMYSQPDVDVFTALAGPLATAIENARLYRKLEEANIHRGRILSTMRGAVVAVDTAGNITTVNQSAIQIFGPLIPGQLMHSINPVVAQLLQRTLAEQRSIQDIETALDRRSGERIPVTMSASCLTDADGTLTGAMVFIYDLTHVKRLEQNVQRADRLSSIGTLAAGMAHEIKNPLVSIKTFTQLMLSRWQDDDFRATFSEVVPHEVERIDMIVTRLLDFSRQRPSKFAPQSLRNIIRKVFALLESQMQKRNVTVEIEFPEDHLEVYGDEQQLYQLFLNLFLNAIDAMDQNNGGFLRVGAFPDTMRLRRNGHSPFLEVECVKVVVSDTGCGIAPEQIKNLFNPFFTTKESGYGLGLSVVHGIATEHGGEVDVSSVLGVGTTFTVTLPLMCSTSSVEE